MSKDTIIFVRDSYRLRMQAWQGRFDIPLCLLDKSEIKDGIFCQFLSNVNIDQNFQPAIKICGKTGLAPLYLVPASGEPAASFVDVSTNMVRYINDRGYKRWFGYGYDGDDRYQIIGGIYQCIMNLAKTNDNLSEKIQLTNSIVLWLEDIIKEDLKQNLFPPRSEEQTNFRWAVSTVYMGLKRVVLPLINAEIKGQTALEYFKTILKEAEGLVHALPSVVLQVVAAEKMELNFNLVNWHLVGNVWPQALQNTALQAYGEAVLAKAMQAKNDTKNRVSPFRYVESTKKWEYCQLMDLMQRKIALYSGFNDVVKQYDADALRASKVGNVLADFFELLAQIVELHDLVELGSSGYQVSSSIGSMLFAFTQNHEVRHYTALLRLRLDRVRIILGNWQRLFLENFLTDVVALSSKARLTVGVANSCTIDFTAIETQIRTIVQASIEFDGAINKWLLETPSMCASIAKNQQLFSEGIKNQIRRLPAMCRGYLFSKDIDIVQKPVVSEFSFSIPKCRADITAGVNRSVLDGVRYEPSCDRYMPPGDGIVPDTVLVSGRNSALVSYLFWCGGFMLAGLGGIGLLLSIGSFVSGLSLCIGGSILVYASVKMMFMHDVGRPLAEFAYSGASAVDTGIDIEVMPQPRKELVLAMGDISASGCENKFKDIRDTISANVNDIFGAYVAIDTISALIKIFTQEYESNDAIPSRKLLSLLKYRDAELLRLAGEYSRDLNVIRAVCIYFVVRAASAMSNLSDSESSQLLKSIHMQLHVFKHNNTNSALSNLAQIILLEIPKQNVGVFM